MITFITRATAITSAVPVDESKPRFKNKVSPAKLRDYFIQDLPKLGAEARGFSIAQHQGKLTINGEPVSQSTFEGEPALSGDGLRKLGQAFAKMWQFQAVGKVSDVTYYQDAIGNAFSLGKAIKLSFMKKSAGPRKPTTYTEQIRFLKNPFKD